MSNYADQLQALADLDVAKSTMAALRVLDTPGILDEGWVPYSGYFWAHNHGNDIVHRCLLLNNTIKISYRAPSGDIVCIVPTMFPADSRCNFLQEDGQFAGVVGSTMRVPRGDENRAIRSLIAKCMNTYRIQWTDRLTLLLCEEETAERPITIAELQNSFDIATLPDRLDIIDDVTAEPEILQIAHQLQLLSETALQEVVAALNSDKMSEISRQTNSALQQRTLWTREISSACTLLMIGYLQHMWHASRFRVLFMLFVAVLSVVIVRTLMLQAGSEVPSDVCDALPWIATNHTCTDAYCAMFLQWQSLQTVSWTFFFIII